MGNNTQTAVNGLPRMITTERAQTVTAAPPLPTMSPEFAHGGEWMTPQWKKNLKGYKGMFTSYPIQMAIILVLTIGLAIGLAFASGACAGTDAAIDDGSPTGQTGSGIGGLEVSVDEMRIAENTLGETGVELILYATNISGDALIPSDVLCINAVQDGTTLSDDAYFCEEYHYGASQNDELQADDSRYIFFFFATVDPNGGVVSFRVTDQSESSETEFTFDPSTGEMSDPSTDPGTTETDPGNTETDPGATETDPTDGGYSSGNVTGNVGDTVIEVTGYSLFGNAYGNPALLLELDVTNNGDADSPFFMYSYYAYQGDEELSESTSNYPEYHAMLSENIPTGETHKVFLVFHGVDPEGGDVSVYIEDYWDEDDYLGVSLPLD